MGTTTMGVKLDDATRERIKSAATRIDRTPHWLIKQAIFSYLEQLENSDTLPELPALLSGAANESDEAPTPAEEPHQPFLDFAEQILPQSVSRAAITAAYRRPETEAVSMLLEQARLPQPVAEQAHKLTSSICLAGRRVKKRTIRLIRKMKARPYCCVPPAWITAIPCGITCSKMKASKLHYPLRWRTILPNCGATPPAMRSIVSAKPLWPAGLDGRCSKIMATC